MNKNFLKQLIVILSLFVLFGCAATNTTGSKVDSETGTGEKQILFAEYKKNRPNKKAASIGHPKADQLFSSIAKIYGTTTSEVVDKYITRVENCKVALTIEEIRKKEGNKAAKDVRNNLKDPDLSEIEKFENNEIKTLSVVEVNLTEALKLQQAITKLDVKSLVSNPLKVGSALKATKLAKNQITFTIKSLQWLNENRKTYKELQKYAGR